MKARPAAVAQKLLNLYRAQHVIFGGWQSVNQIFINESDADVMLELSNLPTGRMLIAHIENLRSGKTPMNSIEVSLMPYGGLMTDSVASIHLSDSETLELNNALNGFTPDLDGLTRISDTNVVKKFGPEWEIAIRSAISYDIEMTEKWNTVIKTSRAYYLWRTANDMLAAPISERTRARVQAELPEYETYLPMFGDAGLEILAKLRIFVSSV